MTVKTVQAQKIEAQIYGLFDGTIRWNNQCPPERSGAMIALIHLLGASWERAHEIVFNSGCKSELKSALFELEWRRRQRNRRR